MGNDTSATDTAEKSVDERVGLVEEAAEGVLKMLKSKMKAGELAIDEQVEDNYKPENYEKTISGIAQKRADVELRVKSIAAVNEHPVGLAAWATAKGMFEKNNDPARYIAQHTGVSGDDSALQIFKNLEIITTDLAGSRHMSEVIKTLEISSPDAGGVLTTGDRVDSFFAPLRNEAVVMRFGPRTRGIVDGAITVTGLETDVAITWGEEVNTQEIADEPTWGSRSRPTNFAMVLVPISNKALRSRASATILRDVNDSIRFAFAIGLDTAWINATGGEFRPKGLRDSAGNTTNSTGASFDNVVEDVKQVMLKQAQNNVPGRNNGWLMATRSKIHLQFLTDVNDLFPFRTEIMNGTFFGAQLESTNEVTITEGSGDKSFILFTDFSGVLIGLPNELRINTWDQGSYVVGGQQRNPIERKESVITAEAETALLVAQPEFIEEIDAVAWGA